MADMANRAPKERPYHCRLCKAPLAEDELGYVCEHVAHGTLLTLLADPPRKGQLIPDTPCTACGFAMAQKRKNAEEKANIHIVCQPCYRKSRARNIDDFTKADEAKGYVLVKRAHYDRIAPREIKLNVGKMAVGRELKLGFSPIPSTHPISLELMWVRVTCILKGGLVHGALANDPKLFKRKVLRADDTVEFKPTHVLETELPKRKRTPNPKPNPKKKPAKAPKKKAKKNQKKAR